jgi:hypothetical protein
VHYCCVPRKTEDDCGSGEGTDGIRASEPCRSNTAIDRTSRGRGHDLDLPGKVGNVRVCGAGVGVGVGVLPSKNKLRPAVASFVTR